MKNRIIILGLLFFTYTARTLAQIGIGTTTPDASAMLEVKSTTQGMLIPRMTSGQRTAILNPATGLLVFDTQTNSFWFKNATAWAELNTGAASSNWAANGANIYKTNNGNVGIGTNNPLQPLTVRTGTEQLGFSHTNDTITLASKIASPGLENPNYPGPKGAWLGTTTNHPLHLFTNNGNRQITIRPDFVTEFRGITPSIYLNDNNEHSGNLQGRYKNLYINSRSGGFIGPDTDPGTLVLQYGDYFPNGNVGIGTNEADFKLTISDTKLDHGNNTAILKLKARNPVVDFVDGSTGYGYIMAQTDAPGGLFTKGMIFGARQGYPLQFSTNNYSLSMIIANNGNVGIGMNNPLAPLSFSNALGTKIAFWGAGSLAHYGIGIQNSLMQFYTVDVASDIGFGYGNSTNFIERMRIKGNGNVGIGTNNPTQKLSVNGTIRSKEVIVESGWADYVFDENYELDPLEEVEEFISTNKHLSRIPSAGDINKNGLHLGDTQKKMMEKIEELTLYVIQLNKEIKALQKQIPNGLENKAAKN